MTSTTASRSLILVVADVEETRDGIERLLSADGYMVVAARDEDDAVLRTRGSTPSLILMSLPLPTDQLVAVARRLYVRSGISEEVPLVLFCIPTLEEGAELQTQRNIFLMHPDNFNQIRIFLCRLLRSPRSCD